MRRTIRISVIAAGLTLVLTSAASAAPMATTQASQKQALVQARDQLASQAAQTKGAPQAQYDLERRRVDNLIDALERGQRVSPSDVDKAVDDAHSTPW